MKKLLSAARFSKKINYFIVGSGSNDDIECFSVGLFPLNIKSAARQITLLLFA